MSGVPQPTITWFKDNVTVINDNQDQGVLEFKELDLKDRGFYHCEAANIIDGQKMIVMSDQVIVNIESIIEHLNILNKCYSQCVLL